MTKNSEVILRSRWHSVDARILYYLKIECQVSHYTRVCTDHHAGSFDYAAAQFTFRRFRRRDTSYVCTRETRVLPFLRRFISFVSECTSVNFDFCLAACISSRSSLEEPKNKTAWRPRRADVTHVITAAASVQRAYTHSIATKNFWHERRERSNGPVRQQGDETLTGLKSFAADLSYTYIISAEPTPARPIRFYTLAVYRFVFRSTRRRISPFDCIGFVTRATSLKPCQTAFTVIGRTSTRDAIWCRLDRLSCPAESSYVKPYTVTVDVICYLPLWRETQRTMLTTSWRPVIIHVKLCRILKVCPDKCLGFFFFYNELFF